jgi:hypothetical protein
VAHRDLEGYSVVTFTYDANVDMPRLNLLSLGWMRPERPSPVILADHSLEEHVTSY